MGRSKPLAPSDPLGFFFPVSENHEPSLVIRETLYMLPAAHYGSRERSSPLCLKFSWDLALN